MKRKLTAIITTMVLACVLVFATGCYTSRPAVMKKLVGTYQLTTFTRTYTDEQVEGEDTISHDLITEKGITAYLIIASDGTGYYVYGDKDTPPYARAVHITYTYDDKKPDKVKEITYTDGSTTSGNAPGIGRETLGLNFKISEKLLTYYTPAIFSQKYSQSAKYTKLSKVADLSYVQAQLHTTFVVPRYEIAGLDGLQVFDGTYSDSPYIYYCLDIRAGLEQADVYYALKSDCVPVKTTSAPITFDIPADNTSPITLTVAGTTFFSDHYTGVATNLYHTTDQYSMWFARYDRSSMSIEQYTSDLLQAYTSAQ